MREFFIVFIDFFSPENRFFKKSQRIFFFITVFYSILSFWGVELIKYFTYFVFYLFSPIDNVSKVFEKHFDDLKNRTILFVKFKEIDSIINENRLMQNKILEQEKKIMDYKKYEEFDKIAHSDKFSVNSLIYPMVMINNKEMIVRFESGKTLNLNDFILDNNYFLFGKVTGINNILKIARISTVSDPYINIPAVISNKGIFGIINNGVDPEKYNCSAIFIPNEDKFKNEILDGDIVVSFSDEMLTVNNVNIGKLRKSNDVFCIENGNINSGNIIFSIFGGRHYIVDYGFQE